jgi:hypothetical protein
VRAALLAPLAFLVTLLGAATVTPPEASLLVGITAVAIAVTLGASHRALPTAAHTASIAVRARRRRLDQSAAPRQHDPDAAGHTRGRAPNRALAAV